ncbi:hypothetical protein GTQ99_22185 [Kineococcus sp. T13]|uniref:hypothetical protein n=1 Tax=Kineococcus vitellinus TaxID=2696565 RepID=UPI001411EA95|nr:hypothetical protein [Kineococcus vitellinus]NAZ78095.1 hypothetical protein [Kineococcus vitellinus]
MSEHTELRMRVGRETGHTLHLRRGDEPSDLDDFLGSVATPELAAKIVEAWNAHWPAPDPAQAGTDHVEQVKARALQRAQQDDLDG